MKSFLSQCFEFVLLLSSEKTVMVVGGTGRVGTYASYFLARNSTVQKLIIVGRDERKGATVMNNAIINSAFSNGPKEISFLSHDLLKQNDFSKRIQELGPNIIANATTPVSLYPWFEKQRREKRSIPLPITPLYTLPPLLKIMEAIEESGARVHVVNVSAPDLLDAVLSKIGLGPTVGAGTIDLTTQGIRWTVGKIKGVPIEDVSVRMIIHRVHRSGRVPYKEIPHFLKVYVRDQDVTGEFDSTTLISKAMDISGTESLTCPNLTNDSLTAASLVRNTLAILNDTNEIVNAPGVGEMPGGVPAQLSSKGAKIVLPEGLSYGEALKINEAGLKLEGIERIESDGTVVFTDDYAKRLKETGLDYSEMKISEVVERVQQDLPKIKRLIDS